MKLGVLLVASLLVISSGIAVANAFGAGATSEDALACPAYVCTISNGNEMSHQSGPSGIHHAFCEISETMECGMCCNSCDEQLSGMEDPKIVGVCSCAEAEDFSPCD